MSPRPDRQWMNCRHCGGAWEYDWEYCPECSRNFGGAKYPATQSDQEFRDISELVQQIHRAFADVRRGGGYTLHQAHLEGCYDTEAKWLATGEKDPETHWSEVPGWKIETGFSTLSFFDVEGWRFYLPAFLCWSLENWRTSDSTTPDSVIWTLDLTHTIGWNETHADYMERYESLNREQCGTVLDFLSFFDRYSGLPEARSAIESYWRQFNKDG
ncbi:MAG: hypothetical protein P4L85_16245 [Paludisphaera borealis]|uniref:DUF6714 family protein n=1 Tax=Paludisphaera borealis TaxID=1387353 RepID=UPI00283FF2DE|nr:DUF6714 family protein [Paludisphaera borealis]MDR3620904.1 hypothetical protein [Paludisphaera borealis]